MLSPVDVEAATTRLRAHIRRTPLLRLSPGELPGGAPVTLKLEFLQHTGSFKARGAFNRLLTASVPPAGVAAASGGNHGAAVAYAARALGHAATIFVPAPTPQAKLDRIAAYGATIVQGGADYAEAYEACRAHQARTGALDIHAYDDPAVLAGQATVGVELIAEEPTVTHVLVAIGGGGLIGGTAAAFQDHPAQIIGIEPEGCPTWHAAKAAGKPVPIATSSIASDSLGARQLGALSYEILTRTNATSILVPDASIRAAQAWLWDRLRLIAEPGGATALAALLGNHWHPPKDATPTIILCGANTDPAYVSRETPPP